MSSRLHNKFHRHNHHTNSTNDPRYPDASYDPIASYTSPFNGPFVVKNPGQTAPTTQSPGNVAIDVAGDIYVSSNGNITVAPGGIISGNGVGLYGIVTTSIVNLSGSPYQYSSNSPLPNTSILPSLTGIGNSVASNYSVVAGGSGNTINNGLFSFIAGGSGNVINNANTFILGSNITTGLPNYTYVNNLSSLGYINAKKVNIGSSDTTVPLIVGLSGANYNVSITNNGIARYHLYNGGNVTEWVIGQKSNTDHSFKLTSRVGATETDYVTVSATNGYVGLGTSTPFAPLDIALNSTPNNTRQAIFARGADSNFIFAARNGDSTNNTGNVLGSIGVDYIGNSPSPNNDTASIKFLRGGSGQDGSTTFWTNSAERIRIDSSGNVGIGTKVPNKTLTVIGTVSATGAATFGGNVQANSNNIIVNAPATNNANLYLTTTARSYALYSNVGDSSLGIFDSTAGQQRLTIGSTGNVGIGTTAPNQNLYNIMLVYPR